MEWTDQTVKKTGRTVSVISFTAKGFALSRRIAHVLCEDAVTLYTTKQTVAADHRDAVPVVHGLKPWCKEVFGQSDVMIFIGASGIAVRTIAPFLQSKRSDPAVLVADEAGNYVISLLSGHLGGANALTEYVAAQIGAKPVITTASDVNRKLAVDVWAAENDLQIDSMKMAKLAAADIVEGKSLPFFCDGETEGAIPDELMPVSAKMLAEHTATIPVIVTPHSADFYTDQEVLHLIPRALILGIGCKRDKSFAEIQIAVDELFARCKIDPRSIAAVASIDRKADEAGIIALAGQLQRPFLTFSAEHLRQMPGDYLVSPFVEQTVGVGNVCERAAMAALSPCEREHAVYICRKTAKNGVTLALLMKKWGVQFTGEKSR